jgi:hypothetical protein
MGTFVNHQPDDGCLASEGSKMQRRGTQGVLRVNLRSVIITQRRFQ